MGVECRYSQRDGAFPLRPWHDAPQCPKGCGGIGCLKPYNPSGWYGPQDATLFCPACGAGWYGTDDEIEQAMIAECWWDAFNRGNQGEHDFAASNGGC